MVNHFNKIILISTFIIGIFVVLIAASMTILYYSGERQIDPGLVNEVQNEYSVPVEVKIIQTSQGNIAYIVPGKAKWDRRQEKLLYNLSNPKEATLAIIEAIANRDVLALDNLTSRNTKDNWIMQGYNSTSMLDIYRSDFKNIDKPYRFDLETGENNPTEGMLSVRIIRESDEIHLELKKQFDGTWKL